MLTRSTSMGLSDLPDEVLLMLMECLAIQPEDMKNWDRCGSTCNDRLKTLSSMSKTCWRMNQLAEPALYRAYYRPKNPKTLGEISCLKLSEDKEHIVHQPNHNLRRFLHSLLRRPSRRSRVQLLRILSWAVWENDPDDPDSHLIVEPVMPDEDLRDSYLEILPSILPVEHRRRKDLLDELLRGGEGAEVALLLALTPNIRRLELELPPHDSNPGADLYVAMMRQALGTARNTTPLDSSLTDRQGLKKLRHVVLDCGSSMSDDEDDFELQPLDEVSSFLRAPHITTLEVRHAYLETTGEWDCPQAFSSLKNLKLRKVALFAEAIEKLVSSCKQLRTLELVNIKDPFVDDPDDPKSNDWLSVNSALSSQREHLQELALLRQEDTAIPGFGSFAGYHSLRQLSLHESIIFEPFQPVEITEPGFLPPNLEQLNLWGCRPAIVSQLEALLDVVPSLYPRLHTVTTNDWLKLYPRELRPGTFLITLCNHKAVFREANVEWLVEGVRMLEYDLDDIYKRAMSRPLGRSFNSRRDW